MTLDVNQVRNSLTFTFVHCKIRSSTIAKKLVEAIKYDKSLRPTLHDINSLLPSVTN